MRSDVVRKLLVVTAWASVTFIAYATLAHVDFVYGIYFKLAPYLFRPEMKTYARFEHILVFAFFGALFGLAYPRNVILVCCVVLGSAAILEFLQTMTPDRHGTLKDVVEKLGGGVAGIIFSRIVLMVLQRRHEPVP
jgi:VanZ family protein